MKAKALIFIILAGILWGTSCIFVHYLAPYGIDSVQMTGVRGFVSLTVMAGYLLICKRHSFRTSLRSLILFIGGGVALFLTATLYYMSMQMTSVATAVVLLYMSPVIVCAVSVIFLGERMSLGKGLAVALMLAGGFLVSGILDGVTLDGVGIALGILSAVTYAIYNILTKLQMREGDSPYTATLYTFLTISVIALLVARPAEIVSVAASDPLPVIPLLIGIGVVTFIIPYFLYTEALEELSAGVASTLSVLEPVSASLFSVLIFGEKIGVGGIIGILLVAVAVALISLGGEGKSKHTLKLRDEYFGRIQRSEKTIEVRLYDEKRQKIKAGDELIFVNQDTGERMLCEVIALHKYKSFLELFESHLGPRCGIIRQTPALMRDEMYTFYQPCDEERLGVVGIEIRNRNSE
ncbi:MAG: EamA family transporter [Clostridia bacterium]|nr:EamA family transporter [Clostridia bacterium]